jgi:hypothetical protein
MGISGATLEGTGKPLSLESNGLELREVTGFLNE